MFTGEAVASQHGVHAAFHGLGFHAALALVGVKGDRDGFRFALQLPLAVFAVPVVGTSGSGAIGQGVLVLGTDILSSVMKLGRCDGDVHVSNCLAGLGGLVGRGGGTRAVGQDDLAGALAGLDVCTAFGGVEIAVCCQRAIDINDNIHQICVASGLCFCGRISDGLELPVLAISAPLVLIINVHGAVGRDFQLSAAVNSHLYARQQSHILIDGGGSAVDIQSDVIVDGQDIGAGVHADGKYGQRNTIQVDISVHIEDNPVCGRVIGLGEGAALRQFKHGAGSHKGDRGAGGHTAGCDGSIHIFRSARH